MRKTQSDQPSNRSPQSNSTRFGAGWAKGFSIKVQKPSVIKSVYLNTKVTLKHQLHDTTASGPSNRFIPTASCRLQTETIQLAFIRQEGVNKADLWLKTFWLWSEPHRWDQTHTVAQSTSKQAVAIATLSSIRPLRCWKRKLAISIQVEMHRNIGRERFNNSQWTMALSKINIGRGNA